MISSVDVDSVAVLVAAGIGGDVGGSDDVDTDADADAADSAASWLPVRQSDWLTSWPVLQYHGDWLTEVLAQRSPESTVDCLDQLCRQQCVLVTEIGA